MRRPYKYLLLFQLLSLSAFAQKNAHVMDWKTDATLNTYLLQEMHEQYAARQTAFHQALASPKAASNYMGEIKKRYRNLLGGLPAKATLQATITGVLQRDGYRIEKISYESFPHHHVTANLYVPEGKGPFAAALLFCGHEDVSKATGSYQKTAILFAKNGFVVFVIDPVSQSERYQLVNEEGKPLTRGGTTEHTLLNASANLLGSSAPADELWDNVRGLDYLVTRKEVDTARIGCLGNSGGGMQTIYFAGFDPRIKVFAPCSYLATRERTLELGGPADGCAQIPGEGAAGLELDDYLMMAAPKPILVLAGRYDFIDYTGVVTAYNELKKMYAVLHQPEKVQLFTYDDGHGISQPKREAAVTWFRRWLYNDPRPIHEGDIITSTPQELQVTAKGQVATNYRGEVSLPERNLQLFDALATERKKFLQKDRPQLLQNIRKLLALDENKNVQVMVEETGTGTKDGLNYTKLILRRQGQIPMPALLFYPSQPAKKLVIWLPGEGKNKLADSTVLMRTYLSEGTAVLLADLRGLGETEDRAEFNDPKFYNREYRNDLLALHIGRTIVGQRVMDIETILHFAQQNEQLKNLPVYVYASGFAALPALHAALFEPQVVRWSLQLPMLSYREVLEQPTAKDWYSYVIPGVLKYYDLPDLVNIIGKEKIVIGRSGQ